MCARAGYLHMRWRGGCQRSICHRAYTEPGTALAARWPGRGLSPFRTVLAPPVARSGAPIRVWRVHEDPVF